MTTKLKKANEVSKETIREAVKEYCTTKGFSQKELYAKAGVSDGTISKILNGKFEGISDVMFKKLWNVVNNVRLSTLFSTNDYRAVKKACDQARKNCFMIGITGDTGMGKTTALKIISRNRNTFYVSYDKTMKSREFFAAILKELGISFMGNVHEMVNKIVDELSVLDAPLLMIDEAGKLTHNVMLYLHVVRDKTDSNCGIILAGMPYFETNLRKNSDKQKEGYAEFLRRINIWHQLKGLSRNEVEEICVANGIDSIEEIKPFFIHRRFGDLMNAIILHQQLINQDSEN